jgi:hypothetical protein
MIASTSSVKCSVPVKEKREKKGVGLNSPLCFCSTDDMPRCPRLHLDDIRLHIARADITAIPRDTELHPVRAAMVTDPAEDRSSSSRYPEFVTLGAPSKIRCKIPSMKAPGQDEIPCSVPSAPYRRRERTRPVIFGRASKRESPQGQIDASSMPMGWYSGGRG